MMIVLICSSHLSKIGSPQPSHRANFVFPVMSLDNHLYINQAELQTFAVTIKSQQKSSLLLSSCLSSTSWWFSSTPWWSTSWWSPGHTGHQCWVIDRAKWGASQTLNIFLFKKDRGWQYLDFSIKDYLIPGSYFKHFPARIVGLLNKSVLNSCAVSTWHPL